MQAQTLFILFPDVFHVKVLNTSTFVIGIHYLERELDFINNAQNKQPRPPSTVGCSSALVLLHTFLYSTVVVQTTV